MTSSKPSPRSKPKSSRRKPSGETSCSTSKAACVSSRAPGPNSVPNGPKPAPASSASATSCNKSSTWPCKTCSDSGPALAELEQDLARRPESNQADSAELVALRAERDALAARVEELEQRPAAQIDPNVEQQLSDLQRRFELAVEDLREYKTKNAKLESQLAAAGSQSRTIIPDAGGNDWESQKRRLLASLEESADAPETPVEKQQRITIEGTIEMTDAVVAEKDRQIAELQSQLAAGWRRHASRRRRTRAQSQRPRRCRRSHRRTSRNASANSNARCKKNSAPPNSNYRWSEPKWPVRNPNSTSSSPISNRSNRISSRTAASAPRPTETPLARQTRPFRRRVMCVTCCAQLPPTDSASMW